MVFELTTDCAVAQLHIPSTLHPPPCARWPGTPGSWLAGHFPWVLVWTGACYWHGVGGFVFNSSQSPMYPPSRAPEREFPVLPIPPPKKKPIFFRANARKKRNKKKKKPKSTKTPKKTGGKTQTKIPRLRAKLNLSRQTKCPFPIPSQVE